jgi:hypothetical protein
MGNVTTYTLSEEERQSYIKKNPIKPVNKTVADYKWRSQKAADASKEARKQRAD